MVKEGTRSSERLAKRQDGKTATASGVMKSRHNTSSSRALDFDYMVIICFILSLHRITCKKDL